MIRFIEVINEGAFSHPARRSPDSKFTLGEVWINEQYVVSVSEARGYKSLLHEGRLPPDLNESHSFTTVVTNNGQATQTHVVVGSPTSVAKRLKPVTTTLLKG